MHDLRASRPSPPSEIEEAVIGYLRNHPEAADTLDGIVHWWLPRQRYETARSSVEQALGHLVDRGLLRRLGLPGEGTLYALIEHKHFPS